VQENLLSYQVKAIGKTAKELIPQSSDRTAYRIMGPQNGNVVIGKGPEVTMTNGYPLTPGQPHDISESACQDPYEAVWFITDQDSINVYWIEFYTKGIPEEMKHASR
jgi:hypothetical protein